MTILETSNARYVIVPESAVRKKIAGQVVTDHLTNDSSFFAEKPHVVVTELRIPASSELLYDSRYPNHLAVSVRFSEKIWNVLKKNNIPVAVMEPGFEPEQYARLINEIDKRLAKRRNTEDKISFLGKFITGGSAAGLLLHAGYKKWEKREQKNGKTGKKLSRRAFLGWVATVGIGVALTQFSPSLSSRIADKSIFMHEGRSAWMANSCERVLASFIKKKYKLEPGKKPTIALLVGNAHVPLLIDYLKHPAKCDSMLKKFSMDYNRSVPRWRDNIFFFRFGRNGRLQRQDIPINRHLWDFSFGPRRQESLTRRPPKGNGKTPPKKVVMDRRSFLRLPRSRLRRV